MENLLELSHVRKSFAGFNLQDISFELPAGFIMGFIGPNGAGKTTTIKLILNMLTRAGGSIRVFGKDNIRYETEIKDQVGVVLDNPFYVEDWTLAQVGKALKPFYTRWDAEAYRRRLWDFALDPKKKVKDLSRGMKMKLMIACALSHDARLLILDEPTGGLDAVARNELMSILSSFIADERRSVFFSTHITSDLEKVADYITFINGGKILYTGTKDDLLEKYVVVKGGLGALSEKQKSLIIGYREHIAGFDGIAEKTALRDLPPSVVSEPCNLDELVIRFNAGAGGARHE